MDVSMPCQSLPGCHHCTLQRTYRDRRLSVLELSQGRMARLGAQSIANALDKPGVRGPGKDNGTAHSGRPKKRHVLVV